MLYTLMALAYIAALIAVMHISKRQITALKADHRREVTALDAYHKHEVQELNQTIDSLKIALTERNALNEFWDSLTFTEEK